jgi:NNP family nitrate/nitrite transporter-like MFS transporter
MTTTVTETIEREQRTPLSVRGHWISDWRPEDPTFWRDGGSRIARRNLAFSIFS